MDFRKFLTQQFTSNQPVFFDGGMGTMIQSSGVTGFKIPEDLNFSNPDVIKSIYRKYLDAGSNVVSANTFGANPIKLEESSYTAQEYISQTVRLMKEAIAECEADGNSNPHFAAWDSGQVGKLLEPMGTLTFDEAYEAYKTCSMAAEKAGADLAIIETMSDLYEVKAAVLAIKENTNLPVVASMTFQENLRTLTGADVLTCVTYLETLRVDALGFNCGGSLKDSENLSEQFLQYAHIPVLAQPNAGIPEVTEGKTVFHVSPEQFAQTQKANRQKGITILGGCCGTTPSHIKAMIQAVLEDSSAVQNESEENRNSLNYSAVCSGNKTVIAGGSYGPVIVGERINPTGKKKCKEALINGDMNFIINEAESQIEAGSHILDVNAGLPGIDEKETMSKILRTLQKNFNCPLQIDSSEPEVLEKALRYYNGKPLVNSVNGKAESMKSIFPIVKKYGGAVVALCLDEKGIPQTAEGRVKIAEKIIREAEKYGIPQRDIFIDTLTLTVSSEQDKALETVRAISILKNKYGHNGLQFILGVSNISFGLPRRDIINSRFLSMALQSGLTACIINPLSEPMIESFMAYRALAGFDKNCLDYIEKFQNTLPAASVNSSNAKNASSSNQVSGNSSGNSDNQKNTSESDKELLQQQFISVIQKGFKDQAGTLAEKLLEKMQPVEIINNCIVPALDSVGKDFETGRKFLPQLLLSAETVGNAFTVIKNYLSSTGLKEESKGTIAIATVYGDIHDIGKNIVKAMLENYGYTVIDLGKNVPAATIIQTVIENKIQLVGLSALMTTTVSSMEKTIHELRAALKEKGMTVKIMVGGAVLTEDYAKKIDADYYAKDAMKSVEIAKEVYTK